MGLAALALAPGLALGSFLNVVASPLERETKTGGVFGSVIVVATITASLPRTQAHLTAQNQRIRDGDSQTDRA